MKNSSQKPLSPEVQAFSQELAPSFFQNLKTQSVQIGKAKGPALAIALARLAEAHQGTLCVLAPPSYPYQKLEQDLSTLLPKLEYLRAPSEPLSKDYSSEELRSWYPFLSSLLAFRKNPSESKILFTTPASMLSPLPDENGIDSSSMTFERKQEYNPEKIMKHFIDAGYERVAQVEEPGHFSQRGGILDFWPYLETYPIRLDFFGEQLENLKYFDATSQRSLSTHQRVQFSLLTQKELETSSPQAFSGIFNYLPENTLKVTLEYRELLHHLDGMRTFLKGKEQYQRFKALEQWLQSLSRCDFFEQPLLETQQALNLSYTSLGHTNHGSLNIAKKIKHFQSTYSTIKVYAGSPEEALRFEHFVEIHKFKTEGLSVYPFELSESVLFPQSGEALLSGAELFGKEQKRFGIPSGEKSLSNDHHRKIEDFIKLEENDFVVHKEHGIARYRGLETLLTPDGKREEYLHLQFAENTEIHVPISQAEMVQKYIGSRGSTPKLSRYQSHSWQEKKKHVEIAVLKLATEMIELQALRMDQEGFSFPAENELLHDFVEAFPYRDTPDQEKAWHEIQTDMEQSRPMDRLLCGDVGFGKTELAIRAAFKCALAGKQTAILVPTTVLCQQHFLSFSQRMQKFPVIVDSLSRLKTAKEQKATLKRLSEGKIDILIGTHRIVSKDVIFKDLGLAIIDEEQRFGVKHKEALKKMRSSVDVLTLTATPIPRTLHMALLGVRDISSLTTAPKKRQPIATQIQTWNRGFLADAIDRELKREGQIFFIHNRIHDIEIIVEKLQAIAPKARITYAHGRMKEQKLETNVLAFINHHYDLLVATTIIENGIDIARANTIFIDQADHYGLAELHQLRGRVGRYDRKAYCYLLVSDQLSTQEASKKRLQAILEHAELGAGFRIAMRDLEIRGAGNIIGTEQSGHIASIGYDLYCQILERTMRKLQGENLEPEKKTSIKLNLDTVLPEDYIQDPAQRIQTYRLIHQAGTPSEARQVKKELEDRFGNPPQKVKDMLKLAVIRKRLEKLGVLNLNFSKPPEHKTGYFRLKIVNQEIYTKMKQLKAGVRQLDTKTLFLPLGKKSKKPREQLDFLFHFLQSMVDKKLIKER